MSRFPYLDPDPESRDFYSPQLPYPNANPVPVTYNGQPDTSFEADEQNNPLLFDDNGRRYGTEYEYLLPVDEPEKARMDLLQTLMDLILENKLFSSPLPARPGGQYRILDLGTGTGIWAIKVARTIPTATVLGVDFFSFLQPANLRIPNVYFMKKNLETQPWDEIGYNWDLIHIRMLKGSISDWGRFYSNIYHTLTPVYGRIEQVEMEYTLYSEYDNDPFTLPCALTELFELFRTAMRQAGRVVDDVEQTVQVLRRSGYVDVRHQRLEAHLNPWSHDTRDQQIARFCNLYITQGLQAMILAPASRYLNMRVSDIQELARRAKDEACQLRYRLYLKFHVFTARRPG